MDMNTMTLPRKGLKKYDYNIDMEKKDLKKLTKGQLIKLLSKKVSNHEDLLDNDPLRMKLHKSLQNQELENGKA